MTPGLRNSEVVEEVCSEVIYGCLITIHVKNNDVLRDRKLR